MTRAFNKQKMVNEIFSSVSNNYDLMNDLMSFGLHRLWKKKMMHCIPNSNGVLLDLASGTADIALQYLRNAEGKGGRAVLCDINSNMLISGRDKLINNGLVSNYDIVCADGLSLPFKSKSFDFCTMAFGIRNVPDIAKCLKQIHSALKPGGKFVCIEFSPMEQGAISQIYDFYSLNIIPKIGKFVTKNEGAYDYLVDSIRKFPKPNDFKNMIEVAGFKRVSYELLSFGVVAIHCGYMA